jgi:hypothetical protein
MERPPIAVRRAVPYIVSGASGIHILARLWRSTRLPARRVPLHVFLLKHTDVILVVLGSPIVIRHLATEQRQRSPRSIVSQVQPLTTFLSEIVHQLRQVFTALLLGLGLIRRKATAGKTRDVARLVERLKRVVSEGVMAVNDLDSFGASNGSEVTSDSPRSS